MSRAVRQMSPGCPATISMHAQETSHGNFWRERQGHELRRVGEHLGDSKDGEAKLDHITTQTYGHANVLIGMDENTDIQ